MLDLLNGLANRHLFITGGTGVVGKCLLDALIEFNQQPEVSCRATVLSRNPHKFQLENPKYSQLDWLSYLEGDILSLPGRTDLRFNDVIHAAADTHLQQDPWLWIEQIVRGTRNVLEFAKLNGASRFINISSGAVYGEQPSDMESIPETYKGAPSTQIVGNVYGQAKRLAEQICTVYRSFGKLEIINVRLFAIASHHLPMNGPYAFSNFIANSVRGEPIIIKGNGQVVRSYLEGDSMAVAILGLIGMPNPPAVINIGSDKPVSILELANTIAEIFSNKAGVLVQNQLSEADGRNYYIPNVDLALSMGLLRLHAIDQIVFKVKNQLFLTK